MPAESAPPSDPVLGKVNAMWKELGAYGTLVRLPEDHEAYAPLKGKRALMVDDGKMIITNALPGLSVATGGNAAYILHTGESEDALADAIFAASPDIVLMDYHLAGDVEGDRVTRLLKERGFSGAVVGFSSDTASEAAFKEAGAIGTVDKTPSEAGDLDEPIRNVALLVGASG